MVAVEVEVMTQEVLDALLRFSAAIEPRSMALPFTQMLRRDFQAQIEASFASGSGADGGSRWAPLSAWRVRDRGGSASPMLTWTGDLQDEASRYKGTINLVGAGFNYLFPAAKELSGKAWGTFAGQLVNPLGATPLAAFPRPVLGGNARQQRAAVEALVKYFTMQGWEVTVQ